MPVQFKESNVANIYSDDYAKLRPKIKNGDIVFIKNDSSWISKLIHYCTFSSYSHVGIAVWVTIENERRLMIVETQGGTKKRIVNMSIYDGCEMDVFRSPDKTWMNIRSEVMDRLGIVEYGWIQAIYIGIREFFMKKWSIKLPMKNFSGMICSEFVAKVFNLREVYVSPQRLYEQLIDGYFVSIK